MKQHSQSLYFQDETDHVTLGWMMDQFDQEPYTDLTTNHQPVPVIMGQILIKFLNFNTLFQLIERLRLAMLIFHFCLALVITLKFKGKGLLSIILATSLIYYYFGWYVLAEAIAAPLVIFISLYLLELPDKKLQKPGSILASNLEIIGLHLAIGVVGLTLLPLWPFCLLSLIWIWAKLEAKQRALGLTTLILLAAVVFTGINPFAWYRETITHNLKYFLPFDTGLTLEKVPSLLFFPLTGLLHLNRATARFYLGGSLLLAYLAITQLKKNPKALAFFSLLLLTLNTRVFSSEMIFYQGFHLYPYAAFFSALLSFFVFNLKPLKKQLIFLGLSLLLVGNNLPWLLEKKDKLNEYFINYGTFEAYGKATKIIAPAQATFLSGPNGAGYLNLVSGLPIAGRQLFHLAWAYRVPFLKKEFRQMLKTNPPTFVYFPEQDLANGFYQELSPLLKASYAQLQRSDGTQTNLWAKRSRLKNVSETNWQKFEQEEFKRVQNF